MLLGGTGVGKTELSKALTEFIFNDSSAMLRYLILQYVTYIFVFNNYKNKKYYCILCIIELICPSIWRNIQLVV